MADNTSAIKLTLGFLGSARAKHSLLTIVGSSIVGGVIFWGGFTSAMEATNTQEFCISCHEMRDNVYTEFKKSVHYSNRVGVRTTCPDCHVPKD